MPARFKTFIFYTALMAAMVFLYFLYLFLQPVKDISSQKTDIYVSAEQLIKDFNTSPDSSDILYKNKVLEVAGKVSSTEVSDSFGNIVLDNGGNYIIIANCVPKEYKNNLKALKNGHSVKIKGIYSGYVINDETYMIPAEIKIDKCTVVK